MPISAEDMLAKLSGVPKGTQVFVSYQAGRKPTDRAVREAKKAEDWGIPKRWFQGRLEGVWTSKKGEPVFCVYSETRYNEADPTAQGHYRTFNPALGTLLTLEVMEGPLPEDLANETLLFQQESA